MKSELYFDQDTLNPEIVSDNFKYDSLGRIVRFERTSFYPQPRSSTKCYELNYTGKKLTEIITYDSYKIRTKRDLIEFRNNRTAFEIIDHMNPDVVILGGRSEQVIQRYLYKLDKRGNWIKRYYVKSNEKKILEIKRRIKYEAHNNSNVLLGFYQSRYFGETW